MKRVLRFRLALVALFLLCAALVLALLPELFGRVLPVGLPAEEIPLAAVEAPGESTSRPEKNAVSDAEESPASEPEPAPPVEESAASEPEPASPAEESSASEPEPAPPAEESAASGAEPAPPVEYTPPQNLPLPEDGEWTLRLVNRENPLPADYEPEYEVVQARFVMDKRVAPVARRMISDAWDQGITLVVNSAYRPYSAQQTVYNNRYQKHLAEGCSEEEARRLTESYVAVPGCSEHQLGLAIDIAAVDDGRGSTGWLAAHAPDYGFILRYPQDKTDITHTAYESWHYRYVGVTAAKEITSRGLCLEEYLAG